MQINKELVANLANLSRLHFSDEELDTMQHDLEKMICFVEKLNELDTTGVEPLRHMSEVEDVYRADVADPAMAVSEALAASRGHNANFFQVPKVLS